MIDEGQRESKEIPKFKYVQLKISFIKDENQTNSEINKKMMLQIIDVSHKILYSESKAEQIFLTLINAAVSHELRNPLSSLIGQIANMDTCFDQFEVIINEIEDHPIETIKLELQKIFKKFQKSNKKLVSATKFIDFFVHDILDYTILNRESKKFKA